MNRMKFVLLMFAFVLLRYSGFSQAKIYQTDWTEDEANKTMKKWALEWTTAADWEKRADRIRKGIIKGLKFDQMPRVSNDFHPIIRNTRIMDGYIVENIAIESFPGFYITGNLYRPTENADKCPAILSPHGHWEDRRMSAEVQYRCACLARMGAIVVAWDMVGYGECQQVTHNIPIAMLLQTWNSKRVLDYLISRQDVDSTRIGITGASGGATQTFFITAIDPRIKVSVPVVQVSSYFFGGCTCEAGMPVHNVDGNQTNNVEIAACCAPRPMLIISDGSDWTRHTPYVEFPYIQKVYAAFDAENRIENVHLPADKHDYGPSKRFPMYNFMARCLKLKSGRLPYDYGFDESFVKILPKEDLLVFSKDYPIPADALQGDEAVLKYLNLH